MSSQSIERLSAFPAPGRLGQGTAVEQSRAVAEVQAAVLVARQFPRDEAQAIAKMRTACAQKELAQRAFFRFPRGNTNVSGETIQLAKELARCWGNIQFGVSELRRDDAEGQSEMQAWAWDMESNERASTTFIVPHARWANGQAQKLADFRDVYENNANNGARRLREMIFTVLPVWYIEQAKTACTKTLATGGGDVPRSQRIADCIAAFEGIGVSSDQIETKLGRASAKWTDIDLGNLQVVFQSIQRGEVTIDEEFPQQRVTAEEIATAAAARPAARAQEPAARADEGLAPHEWDIHKLAQALGMSEADLDARCYGVTGGPIADASEAQIRALVRELAAELAAQDNRAGGAA